MYGCMYGYIYSHVCLRARKSCWSEKLARAPDPQANIVEPDNLLQSIAESGLDVIIFVSLFIQVPHRGHILVVWVSLPCVFRGLPLRLDCLVAQSLALQDFVMSDTIAGSRQASSPRNRQKGNTHTTGKPLKSATTSAL